MVQHPEYFEKELLGPNSKKLATLISTQFLDQRSALVRETGSLIAVCAQVYKLKFSGVASRLFSKDVIFKNVNSGTRLISELAHDCVNHILYNCPNERLIPIFS